MNIAGSEPVRFDDQHRHHPNDRRVRLIALRNFASLSDFELEIDIFANLFPEYVRRFISRPVILNQRLFDFLGAAANQLDLALQQKTEAVDRIDIERIAHR